LCQNIITAKARKGICKLNNQHLEDKVRQDAARVEEELTTLVEDSAARFDKLEGDVSQTTVKAMDDVSKWVEDGAAQLSKGFEKVTGDARKTMAGTASTVKKEVGRGLSQYNTKAQKAVDNLSGGFGEKATKYPWVSISIAMALGLVLGGLLLKPIRNTLR